MSLVSSYALRDLLFAIVVSEIWFLCTKRVENGLASFWQHHSVDSFFQTVKHVVLLLWQFHISGKLLFLCHNYRNNVNHQSKTLGFCVFLFYFLPEASLVQAASLQSHWVVVKLASSSINTCVSLHQVQTQGRYRKRRLLKHSCRRKKTQIGKMFGG